MASDGHLMLDLDAWLASFLDVMGRKACRTWALLHLRGLLVAKFQAEKEHMTGEIGFRRT